MDESVNLFTGKFIIRSFLIKKFPAEGINN